MGPFFRGQCQVNVSHRGHVQWSVGGVATVMEMNHSQTQVGEDKVGKAKLWW